MKPQNELLQNINLNIQQGDKVAIVGATGQGKSTLLLLMTRLYDVSKGQILLNGINIDSIPIKQLRSMISYAGQESMLFNDTIFNNITLWNEHIAPERVKEVVKMVGLDKFIDVLDELKIGDAGMCLSGGQRQCIALARAILKDSNILILDEALSSIDKHLKHEIANSLAPQLKDKTVIVVSHQLENYTGFNLVYEIKGGCITQVYSNE